MRWPLLLGALVLLIAIVGVVGYSRVDRRTDEQKVRGLLDTVSANVSRESPSRIVGMLDEGYSDDMGNSRSSLRTNLFQAFYGPREFRVTWEYVEMYPREGDTVSADIGFVVEEMNGSSVTGTHRGTFHATFVVDGRRLRVRRVEGLKELADKVEADYGL